MRPTVHDVAQEAGVSLATVDRVLNGRPGVREETIRRVEAAVARLGFVRDVAAANLAKRRLYRLVFIIPDGSNSFMRGLEHEIEQEQARPSLDRMTIGIVRVPPFDGEAIAAGLEKLGARNVDGIALVATDSAGVRDALARLHRENVPVVTLVSDVPSFRRIGYVGIDNVAAGRTAASLLGRFLGGRKGKVARLAGSMLVRDHVERRMGFDQVIRAEYPHLEVLPVLEGRDDAALARTLLAGCLAENPDIVGLYSMGAGNRGVIEALSQRDGPRIVTIAHELTEHSRAALRDGLFDALINQDAGREVRNAVRILRARLDGQRTSEWQQTIPIQIYLRDNLP